MPGRLDYKATSEGLPRRHIRWKLHSFARECFTVPVPAIYLFTSIGLHFGARKLNQQL